MHQPSLIKILSCLLNVSIGWDWDWDWEVDGTRHTFCYLDMTESSFTKCVSYYCEKYLWRERKNRMLLQANIIFFRRSLCLAEMQKLFNHCYYEFNDFSTVYFCLALSMHFFFSLSHYFSRHERMVISCNGPIWVYTFVKKHRHCQKRVRLSNKGPGIAKKSHSSCKIWLFDHINGSILFWTRSTGSLLSLSNE